MLSVLKATFKSACLTILYWVSSIVSIFWQGRLVIVALLFIVFDDQVLLASQAFWDYLVANSFCPWLMIFRGRPSGIIIAEASYYAGKLLSANDLNTFMLNVSALGSNAAELLGGPALGIALTAVFVFISYKCVALVFNKLFNRK